MKSNITGLQEGKL